MKICNSRKSAQHERRKFKIHTINNTTLKTPLKLQSFNRKKKFTELSLQIIKQFDKSKKKHLKQIKGKLSFRQSRRNKKKKVIPLYIHKLTHSLFL